MSFPQAHFLLSALHEFQNLHAKYKEKIHTFIRGHFYGHPLDLGNTLYFFTAGRYEYRNKGVDIFIEALSRLNGFLKHVNSAVTVVAFIVMPAPYHSLNIETLKGHALVKKLEDNVADLERRIGARIFDAALK